MHLQPGETIARILSENENESICRPMLIVSCSDKLFERRVTRQATDRHVWDMGIAWKSSPGRIANHPGVPGSKVSDWPRTCKHTTTWLRVPVRRKGELERCSYNQIDLPVFHHPTGTRSKGIVAVCDQSSSGSASCCSLHLLGQGLLSFLPAPVRMQPPST